MLNHPAVANMRLSIIIPVFNEVETIQQALQALQSYRQQGHEVIVVDGGSHDDTVARAESLCDSLITSQPGRAVQMNTGAKQAMGDILLFLHADTRLPENAAETIINIFKASNKKVWGRFDVRLSNRHPLLLIVAALMNLRSRLTGIATGDQSLFVRGDVFHQLHGYPNIPLMEDISFSRELLKLSRPLCLRDKVTTSSRRWEQKGILRTILLMWYLRLAYFLGKQPEALARIYSR